MLLFPRIVIAFFLLLPLGLCAGGDPGDSLKTLPPDTLPPGLHNFDEELTDEDSLAEGEVFDMLADEGLCALLNCDLYTVWDTLRINPYGVDMRTKKDTTLLQLVHDVSCDYAHPVCGKVTSDFGFRRSRFHYGIDIDLETGDDVVSVFEGTVRVARYSPTYGYYVIVRHLNGLETLYAHLSGIRVSPGQYLQAGDVIGQGGNTGRSRGSHLHFEVRFLGQQINPRNLISFEEFACSASEIALTSNHFNYLKAADKQKAALAARKYYKVRKGDTLSTIARRHRTTVQKLCKLNKISPKTTLRVGRSIRVS